MPLRITGPGKTQIVDPTSQRSRTGTHLSTNIYILIDGVAVGAVQSLTINEKRQVQPVDEVGTDGHIDSAPIKSTDINGSCKRIRYDKQRIAEAFQRGFVHVAAQRVPFDIQIQDNFMGSDDGSIIVTTVRNVWITGIDVDYNAGNFIITDNMQWVAESIDSIRADGNPVVGNVNSRGIPLEINPFEREADMGKFRGSLDQAGLISAFDGPGGRSL